MLAEVLERSGATDDLVALLASQMDAAKDRSDVPAVASFALRLGKLLEGSDRTRARSVYYTGLDWAAESVELLDALVGTLDGEDDAAERMDVLEHGASAPSAARARRSTRSR